MTIQFAKEIKENYPSLEVAFFLINQCQDYATEEERHRAEKAIVDLVTATYPSEETIKQHYIAKCYKTFYKSLGLNVRRVSTPVDQALRVFKTKQYKSRHKIIDVYMAAELATLVSFHVYDAATIKGDLFYTLATGKENILTTVGEEKTCKSGELLLCDEEKVINSIYYGNNKKTLITKTTTAFLLRAMKVPGISAEDFAEAKKRILENIPVTLSF